MIGFKHPGQRDSSAQARPAGAPLTLSCPRCLGELAVADQHPSQETECPHCRGPIEVLAVARARSARAGQDPPAVISLALGCLALVCLLAALRFGGLVVFAAALLAPAGVVIGIFSKDGRRDVGLAISLLTTGPALVLFFSTLGAAAARVFG